MEDADSGQPKVKKKKTEKGNENGGGMLNCFFLFNLACVCHLDCQTTAAIKVSGYPK